jgi:hypothetical protein
MNHTYDAKTIARFWSKVNKRGLDECWEWKARRMKGGYGQFTPCTNVKVPASRFAFLISKGDIPAGRLVCHTCDNPPCCNPKHLVAETPAWNTRDMIRKHRDNRASQSATVRGTGNSRAVLSDDDVRHIRANRTGKWGELMGFARKFAVSYGCITGVVSGRTWKHLL